MALMAFDKGSYRTQTERKLSRLTIKSPSLYHSLVQRIVFIAAMDKSRREQVDCFADEFRIVTNDTVNVKVKHSFYITTGLDSIDI
jgi:hypothetical protein